MYRLSRLLPLALFHARGLRPRHVWQSAQTCVHLLLRPNAYQEWQESSMAVDAMHLLWLSIPISLLRLSVDPNVGFSLHLLHAEWIPHFLGVAVYALSSALGAVLVPQFWYWILKLKLDRNTFVAAMIVMYVVVEIPWDVSSLVWMRYVMAGDIPQWLPDTIKTAILTGYCSIVGAQLSKHSDEVPVDLGQN